MRKLPLYLQIVIGLILGLVWGTMSNVFDFPREISTNWIMPIGTIFIRLLKMIAVPLVFASLVVGVHNLDDIRKLSRMGGKTIGIYLFTTLLALTIGITVVNIMSPGGNISDKTRQELLTVYNDQAGSTITSGNETKESIDKIGPLAPLVNMVPDNITKATSENSSMLQVVFFALLVGVATIMVPKEQSKYFIGFFNNFNDILIRVIDLIMKVAPFGVFALLGSFVAQISNIDLLFALGSYCITVIMGLSMMVFIGYPLLLKIFTNQSPITFFKGIRAAQILAFSTSSSSATLPVTMESCEQNLKISNKVTSFVLPLGATINMDGTSLYQAIAAVFICQVTGQNLSFAEQLTIVFTALLASIGTAGVPGVGIVMLTIVLGAIGVEEAYIALILGPDRILDMCRTVVNVTGDATTATIIASSEKQI